MKNRTKLLRVIALKVVEVDEILESLLAARTSKQLHGRQRQQLQDVYGELELARRAAHGGVVQLPVEQLVDVLRCAMMTQQWLGEQMQELFAADEDG